MNPRAIVQDDDDDDDYVIVPPQLPRQDLPVSPRRSLRDGAALTSSRESTPLQRVVSYESLAGRPRSNPRTRTPMRYESPLNADAFRRPAIEEEDPQRLEGCRVTVRPLAGAAIGTVLASRRIEEETANRRSSTPKSTRQGPSRRKVRRWDNDRMVGIVADIAKASSRGSMVAEELLKAQADAPMHRSVYNPLDQPKSRVSSFMEDKKYENLRKQFFKGEIGHDTERRTQRKPAVVVDQSPEAMVNRIHARLRNVLNRACHNSTTSAETVDAFEKFLVACFRKGVATTDLSHLGSLQKHPTVTQKKAGECTVTFCFDPEAETGGFHRLLLHSVCQFHGLSAVSSTFEFSSKRSSRVLTVSGRMTGPKIRLLDHI